MCVCSLSYPACKSHAPFCHLWAVRLYCIFFALTHKGQDFREKIIEHLNVFFFSLQLLSGKFFILRRTERDMIKNVYWSSCKVPVVLVRYLMKLEFSRQIFENYPNIKFRENSSSGSRVVSCGRTDRRDEANSRFSQFCERA